MTAAAPVASATDIRDPDRPAPLAARFRAWIDTWSNGPRDLAAARLLITRCASSLAWLRTTLCDDLAAALANAYELFPELWVDLPLHALADRIAAEPAASHEQILSNHVVAQRLDPGSLRTRAILMEAAQIMEPALYMRTLDAWLASSPPQAQVTRLLRRVAEIDRSATMLDYVGRLAAYGEGRRSISGDTVAEFAQGMTNPHGGNAVGLPGGEAFVRARKVVDAASRQPRRASRDTPAKLSATVRRLRAALAAGGYDADRVALQTPGRIIDAPSWIGGWSEYVMAASAFLCAKHLDAGNATLASPDGSITGEGHAPYLLASGPDVLLLKGRYRLKFFGRVNAPTVMRFHARGYTGLKDFHTMAAVTRTVAVSGEEEIGSLEFILDEVATCVCFDTEVLATEGTVTLAGIKISRERR